MNSGGYLYIEKTEAMNVIDVNSGKSIKNKSISETAFQINKEAALEISRQIKLRNLSGIIVIDFIDMDEENKKDEVLSILKECFKDDKCKTVIFPFTQLNIVQIARNRKGKSINEYFEEECPLCEGNGRQLKFTMIKEIIRNDLSKLLLGLAKKHVFIQMNIRYKASILEDLSNFIEEIGAINEVVYIDFEDRISKVKVSLLNSNKEAENALEYRVYG
jgi:ribonuclease G